MEIQKRLFGSIMTHAYVAGVLMPDKFLQSGCCWQFKLFRIYQVSSCLFLLTVLVGQFAAMYRYWGDTVILLETIGNTAATVVATWGNLFTILCEERIHGSAKRMKTNSVLVLPVVQTQPRLKEVMDRMQRKLSWVCLGVRISLVCSILFWIVSPFIIRFLIGQQVVCHGYQNRTMTPQELLQNDGYDQFCFIMWLPIDAKKWYSYLLLYQITCYMLALKNILTYTIIMVYFFVLTAAEFELIGVLVLLVDAGEEEEIEASDTTTGPMSLLSKQVKDPTDEKSPTMYLKEIIKLHQIALEAAADVNSIQGVCFSVCIGAVMTMIITSLFQITVVPSLTPKFLCVIIACLMQIFIFSLFGETIFAQFENVGDKAYSTKWYERPKEFQRLIYMILVRTSSPTIWNVMGIIRLRITVFAEITSVCYRVFMLMLETDTERAVCFE